MLCLDPPLEFVSGLVGTGVAGLIPIPGLSDAVGNVIKQGIEMAFSDHKFDVEDLTKDVVTGLVMDKVSKRFAAVTRGIRGNSKKLFVFLIFCCVNTGDSVSTGIVIFHTLNGFQLLYQRASNFKFFTL